MQALAKALASTLVLALVAIAAPVGSEAPTPLPADAAVQFGMDAASMGAQSAAGVAPDLATFWVGPWTLSSGWGGPDAQLKAMRDANVTPAIHLYYWGDDISQSCLSNGCWSSLHNAQKTQAGWSQLTDQLAAHLNTHLQGRPALIFLESEYNKADVQTWEPLDEMLAAKAARLHELYPAAQVVLSVGNWNSAAWKTWDRAAAESDLMGLQGMRGSTRDSATSYANLYEATLAGTKTLGGLFGKPVVLTDIALSSHPEPDYLARQGNELGQFFTNLGELRDAGVVAMIYRSWKDSPHMDLANYYGEAERHWGLAWASNGTYKPAAKAWVDGVTAERSRAVEAANVAPIATVAGSVSLLTASLDASGSADPDGDALSYAWSFGDGTTGTGPTATHEYASAGSYTVIVTVSDGQATASASRTITTTAPYKANVTVASGSNEWWVEAKVSSSPAPSKVEVRVNNGTWQPLTLRSWGNWALSTHIVKGSQVAFKATAPDGQSVTTPNQQWIGPAASTSSSSSTSSTTTTKSSTTTSTASFKATFSPKAVGNDYWVESGVSANQAVTKVEAKVGSGAWTVLPKTDWGTYAKSLKAPNGSLVTFRATSSTGAVSTSAATTWT